MDAGYRAKTIGVLISLTIAGFVTYFLLAPVPDTPAGRIPGIDKVVHFTMFFLIALPALCVAPRAWGWIVALVVIYGGMIEIIQPIFGRGRELADLIANSLGALSAVPVGRFMARRVSPSRKGRNHKRSQPDSGIGDT